jgi:hypothetical protein
VATTEAQDRIRTANDRIYNMTWSLGRLTGRFLCECDLFCTEEVSMKPSEYARLREQSRLVYAPGHGTPEGAGPALPPTALTPSAIPNE